LYLVVDATEIWPRSHLFALVTAVVGVLALLLLDGGVSTKRAFIITAATSAACTALYLFAPPILPDETEIHGWLFPATEPSPANACDLMQKPQNALLFVLGSNGAWTTDNGPSTVLEVGSCVSMSMRREEEKLAFDADIFDASGDLIARIDKNEFNLVPGKYSYQKRSEDRSAMTVYDRQGKELLFVHYLNKTTVKLRGSFACSDMTNATVTDTVVLTNDNHTVITQNCQGAFRGKNAGFKLSKGGFRF
jgi:hypothetical protein